MKRPLSVTILSWLFIATGTIGFFYHLPELRIHNPLYNDSAWILAVRLLAVVAGVMMLRGSNGGRWLLIAWMAYHVVLSYFHAITELIVHAVFLVVIIFILLHPKVSGFFKRSKTNTQK
jgi:hypothetical protein